VISVDWARKSIAYLKEKAIQLEYKEYPIGHGVSPQNFYDLKSWMDKILK
jgi:phospholipase/carboxylesterase